ncbi:MAG: acetate kinase, partial [Bacteroidales bacterium]
SGMLGVSGISSDMRDLGKAASENNARAKLTLQMFSYKVKKYIGAYAAALSGVDLLLFTGGIGENDYETRAAICEGLEFMGVSFDKEVNRNLRGIDTIISRPESKVKVVLVTTDEEKVIATDTYNIVNK